MSESAQFRQYAEEAMRCSHQSKTHDQKQSLIDLARIWTQAAVQSERIFSFKSSPPDHRAPSEPLAP